MEYGSSKYLAQTLAIPLIGNDSIFLGGKLQTE